MRRAGAGATLAAVVAIAAAGPTSAQALTTIGELAPPSPPDECHGNLIDLLPLTSGNTYVVPSPGGVITSWSTNAGLGVGQTLKFKVFRLVEGTTFSAVGHDSSRPLVPSALNTFSTDIPVQAGDLIGLNLQDSETVPTACAFATTSLSDSLLYALEDVADGASATFLPEQEKFRLNITATVLPPPAIASLSRASGSIQGGTAIAISGSNFAQVKGVSFGAIAASSFTVDSEGQITATAPPAAAPGEVDVSVTTLAGSTAAGPADRFTYTACVVPKLRGKSLRAARRALARADCKLGKVRGKRGKKARVKKQSAKPHSVLAPGAKIAVKVGRVRGKRHKGKHHGARRRVVSLPRSDVRSLGPGAS